eukprot:2135461-Rhodomonas_salina.2
MHILSLPSAGPDSSESVTVCVLQHLRSEAHSASKASSKASSAAPHTASLKSRPGLVRTMLHRHAGYRLSRGSDDLHGFIELKASLRLRLHRLP